MDNIKFRAWLIDEKRMVTHTQEFVPLRVTNFGLERLSPTMENNHWHKVDVDIINMPWVGLIDTEKVDIYIDDICEFDNGDRFVLKMSDWLEVYVDWIGDSKCEDQARDLYRVARAKVIGNAHQNPELLQGQLK